MDFLVFKTNIKSRKKVEAVKSVFEQYEAIKDWSVDTQDVDNVLRVRNSIYLNERDVIKIVSAQGFHCEVLPD